MEVDAETTGGWRAAAFRVKLDYENLPDRLKNAPRPSDRERLDHELRDAVEEKAADLARLEPNMKAIEQYEGLKEKEAEQVEALEDSRRRTKEAAEAFDAIMQERESTFMAAFEHISGAIDRVYKELTSSRIHPMGGTAYLNLEDTQEPYNSGVRFSAMPPTKRFRDMDQLSGGEKTMAALALIFAIHSYRSSPFFILDEVDAALDKTNVEKMAQFIRNRSHGTNPGNEGKALPVHRHLPQGLLLRQGGFPRRCVQGHRPGVLQGAHLRLGEVPGGNRGVTRRQRETRHATSTSATIVTKTQKRHTHMHTR